MIHDETNHYTAISNHDTHTSSLLAVEYRRSSPINYYDLSDDLHSFTNPLAAQFPIINHTSITVLTASEASVDWRITDTNLSLDGFTFHLERSGSPDGAFTIFDKPERASLDNIDNVEFSLYANENVVDLDIDEVNDVVFKKRSSGYIDKPRIKINGLKNVFTAIDDNSPNYGKYRRPYYRVSVLKDSTNEIYFTKPVTYYGIPDCVGLEIAKRYNLLLKTHVGVKCFIYKRKQWGRRCTVCWDVKLQRNTKTRCIVCYDTTYEGGYWYPIETYINFEPSRLIIQQTIWGRTEPNALAAWTGNYPFIEPQDIIVDPIGNKRWMIKNVSTNEKRRIPLKQILQLEELDRGRIEYSLPVSKNG